jgi:NADH-quinone oxidoreductase subunit N
VTGTDFVAILPLLVLGGFAVAILLAAAFYRRHRAVAILTLTGLAAAAASIPWAASIVADGGRRVTPLLVVDRYGLLYAGLLLAAGFAVAAMSYGYLKKREGSEEEYYLLLTLATWGGIVLVLASHFASFFLGLEVLSVALYALVGYHLLSEASLEASIKYLVLAATSAAFLVFGMALVYAETGTMDLSRLIEFQGRGYLYIAGFSLMIVGIGFKLAVAPFHMWTADVYQGAPAPVTAFIATVSKGAMVGLLLRFFLPILPRSGAAAEAVWQGGLWTAFAVLAILSMVIGNLLALLQTNVKRLLAYSSIAHLGYILVAFLAGYPRAATSVTYYLAAYFATTLAAFGTITALSGPERDAETLEDFRGLFSRRPWAAGIMTAALLSLAGMPLTAGFVGKFYVVLAGVGSGLWAPVLVLVAASAVGLYYYLRVVVSIFQAPTPEAIEKDRVPYVTFGWVEGALLGGLGVLVFWLGLYPGPIVDLIGWAVGP